MLNYWWVTRPKRKLTSVPDALALVMEEVLGKVWHGNRTSHLSIEAALEARGLKRRGERRDQGGGGARTYIAWLESLGLIFAQSGTGRLCLTLAGEALLRGESPVKILTAQVLKYQFPSAYSVSRGVDVAPRFRVHPFWLVLKLLCDRRVQTLSREEIGYILVVEGENESEACYEHLVARLQQYRAEGEACLPEDLCERYSSPRAEKTRDKTLERLSDIANTMMNWLEYTQLVVREAGRMSILPERLAEVLGIVTAPLPFIARADEHEVYQRRYGLDPWHSKDTRNLAKTLTVTAEMIATQRIKRAFIAESLKRPLFGITKQLVKDIAEQTGIIESLVSETLYREFPHGAIGGFMTNYFDMAFKGREKYREFEQATAALFSGVFGFEAIWLGSASSGSEVPDVLLVSREARYQAIIDTKAYSEYELPTIHRDRMIYHYIPDMQKYGDDSLEPGFFSYIAGGFSSTIATHIKKIASASGVGGSALAVGDFIRLVEQHAQSHYTHEDLRQIFSLNRKIELADFERKERWLVAEDIAEYKSEFD